MSIKNKKTIKKAKIFVFEDKFEDEEKEKPKTEETEEPKSLKRENLNKVNLIIYIALFVVIMIYFPLAFYNVVPLVFSDLDLTLNIVALLGLTIPLITLMEAIELIFEYINKRRKEKQAILTKKDKISRSTKILSIMGLLGVTIYFLLTFFGVIPVITTLDLPDGLGKTILESLGSSLILLGILTTIFWGIISSVVILTPKPEKKAIVEKRDQWIEIATVIFAILGVVAWYLYFTNGFPWQQ